jgi:hypothetical protein
MINVYFLDSRNERRIIGLAEDRQSAMRIIMNFLAEHNYKSYYTRSWTEENGEEWIDVGSHTEFFILKRNDKNGKNE